ncbi:MAG: ABC transporter substrate-binding protein [Alphaproteobacteria bacterium]|nr:MAG: ABC transporter substrate-binding protein [Alphaproteobacteria bacterium]TAF14880.1 MAG: ABC transporter substrate-binding protein [Alphaproteobacteria bacterium]TAF41435.1 MAG: ABC transporter substrate-binding protein [Alphaproteobacteria bacterium]TAF75396.1 MAG: ABC transporter substrate-binding protein [Alphaproteobacteria bacterium]
MTRFFLMIASTAACLSGAMMVHYPAQATPANASAPAEQQTAEQAFVHHVSKEVLNVLHKKLSAEETQKQLEVVFNDNVDIDWVGRFVLARHWNNTSPAQRQKFLQSYRAFMTGNYTKRLRDYAGEHYTVSTPRAIGNGRSVLTMKVQSPNGGEPLIIDYKIRQSSDGFKIYDLVVEGISLISTQRSEFDSVINRKGIDFLIDALNKKAQSAKE